jgi:hypothetical protein
MTPVISPGPDRSQGRTFRRQIAADFPINKRVKDWNQRQTLSGTSILRQLATVGGQKDTAILQLAWRRDGNPADVAQYQFAWQNTAQGLRRRHCRQVKGFQETLRIDPNPRVALATEPFALAAHLRIGVIFVIGSHILVTLYLISCF